MMPYRIQPTSVPNAFQSGSRAVSTASKAANEKTDSMAMTMAIKATPKSVSASSQVRVGSAWGTPSKPRRLARIAPRRTSERPTRPLRKKTGRLLPRASRSVCNSGSTVPTSRMPSNTPKPTLKDVASCPYSNPACARGMLRLQSHVMSTVPSSAAKMFSPLSRNGRRGPTITAKATSQPRKCSHAVRLPLDERCTMCSTTIAHQSRPRATSATPPAPRGGVAFVPATIRVSSTITSAIGCASMLLAAIGMAKHSIQVEGRSASTDVVVAFITGVPCEFMPNLPSAQSMHGHIKRLCTHLALRVASEGQVDGCSMRPKIHQALDRFLAQHCCRTDEDDGRPKREGETFGIDERVHRRAKIGQEPAKRREDLFALLA